MRYVNKYTIYSHTYPSTYSVLVKKKDQGKPHMTLHLRLHIRRNSTHRTGKTYMQQIVTPMKDKRLYINFTSFILTIHHFYNILIKTINRFHIAIYEDKSFLPYSSYCVDAQTIMECIIISLYPYICDDFRLRDMPTYRVCGFDRRQ